jgi:hypothetical protein
MNKIIGTTAVILLACIGLALAGQVYDRTTQTIPVSGTIRWTNSVPYAALELKRIWIENPADGDLTCTVSRITVGSTFTQAVGSVVMAATGGSTASFTASYLKYGDMLRFVTCAPTTNSTAVIEYEVQQH